MSNFSFASLNKERNFDFDTSKITGEYTNLEGLYKRDGEGVIYQLKGAYISTKSEFAEESPIIAIADTYVNLPQHQLLDVKAILSNKQAIAAINDGEAGFVIRTYTKTLKGKNGKAKNKECYSAEWVEVDPANYESDDEPLV